MSKVYVVNYAGHNVHQAKKYGELVFVTEGRVDIFNTDRNVADIAKKLVNYTDDDYILLSGSPLLVFILTLICAVKADSYKLLLYNCKKGDYELRTVFKHNIIEVIKEVNSEGNQ